MITITRKFEFDSAHRVLGHGGKCRHIHGHRYVALVTVKAPELDELGMVIDFSVIKEVIGKWIDDNWDHNILLNSDDPQAAHFMQTENREPFLFPAENPTAENIAMMLSTAVIGLLHPKQIEVTKVRIYETPNCYADYIP